MIRIVSALFAFAVMLCAWIVLRDPGQPSDATPPMVTRSSTPTETIPLADLSTTESAPALPIVDQAAITAAVAEASAPQNAPDETTASVLSTLTQIAPQEEILVAQAETAVPDATVQSTLAGIMAARGLSQAPDPSQGLTDLVTQALNAGESDAYIQAMLQEVAEQGHVDVSSELRTTDGSVDTRVLLSQIVSQANASGADIQIPEQVATPVAGFAGGAGVETRTVQRASGTETYRFYTVQSGDSLGGIAHHFYGDAALYVVIFEANRQMLSSPDRIRRGQRLVIPKL